MGIVSYAQNFEDVMLWRALHKVSPGFYVDVGAQDPLVDSVSRAFHDRGWRGIHVEPVSKYAELLRRQRPGDDVIEAVVSQMQGLVPFFEVAGTGLSTANARIANGYSERGLDVVQRLKPSISLDDIALSVDGDVHWLKIDVEGHERDVLESWNSAFRPWILVVESTLPMSQCQSHQSWENIILDKDYKFVWFDGLNRFYLHKNHLDLACSFSAPPNVFDEFSLSPFSSSSFSTDIRTNSDLLVGELEDAKLKIEGARSWAEAHLAAVCREKDEALALAQAGQASLEERLRVEIDAKDRLLLAEQFAGQAAALALEARHQDVMAQWMSILQTEKSTCALKIKELEDAHAADRRHSLEHASELVGDLERASEELEDVKTAYERTLKGVIGRAAQENDRLAAIELELREAEAALLKFAEQSKLKPGFLGYFSFGAKLRTGARTVAASIAKHMRVRQPASYQDADVETAHSVPAASNRIPKMNIRMLRLRKDRGSDCEDAGDTGLRAMLRNMAGDINVLKSHVTPPKAELLREPVSAALPSRASDVFGALARAIGPRTSQDG